MKHKWKGDDINRQCAKCGVKRRTKGALVTYQQWWGGYHLGQPPCAPIKERRHKWQASQKAAEYEKYVNGMVECSNERQVTINEAAMAYPDADKMLAILHGDVDDGREPNSADTGTKVFVNSYCYSVKGVTIGYGDVVRLYAKYYGTGGKGMDSKLFSIRFTEKTDGEIYALEPDVVVDLVEGMHFDVTIIGVT